MNTQTTARFWSKVFKSDRCWIWLGWVNRNDYGMYWHADRSVAAHRVAYELTRGPIPDGLVLDHLCRTPSCVRPDHLEAVTVKENVRRGVIGGFTSNSEPEKCLRGHSPHDAYINGRAVVCRACRREANNNPTPEPKGNEMYLSTYTYSPIEDSSEETNLILDAQAGSESAMTTLISAYVPLLVQQVKSFKAALQDVDDAEQEVLATFLGHIHGIDVTKNPTCKGFTNRMGDRLREVYAQKNGLAGLDARSMAGYTRLKRNAEAVLPGGTSESEIIEKVAELIKEINRVRRENGSNGGAHISFDEFIRIHNSVSTTSGVYDSEDYADEADDHSNTLETEYTLIRECVDRLPSDERAIVRYAYGFETPRDLTDAEIREEWSRAVLTHEQFEAGDRVTSRRTIARKHQTALGALRADFLSGFNGCDEAVA